MTQPEQRERNEAGVEGNLARHGKVSYMRIPAADPVALSQFYEKVFRWQVGGRPEHVSFKDASGEMIGAFEPDEVPERPGILPYISVERIDSVVRDIEANGGTIVRPVYAEEQLWVATFRDPAGNVMGIWQAGGER
jgi:predicted enzyme related to lactoylglutathione lyase